MGYATHSVRLVAAATGIACSIVGAIAVAQARAAPPAAPATPPPPVTPAPAASPTSVPPAAAPRSPAPVPPTATDANPGASAVPTVTAAQVDAGDRPLDFVLEALRQGVEPMDADEAAERAVKSAPSMAKARAVVDQAREAAAQAVVAVWPRLDLIGQYTRLSPPPLVVLHDIPFPNATTGRIEPTDFPLTPPVVDQFLLQARMQYPVSDLFFAVLPRYQAAQDTARAQKWSERAQSFTVGLQARESFYNYARARAALLVGRFAVAQTEAQLKDVESLVRAGTVARVEQMRAEANLASARVAVARAEGAVAIARTSLRTLLHVAGDQDISLTEDFSQQAPPLDGSKEELLQSALRNRSELKALETLSDAQSKNIRANDADKLPKLSVSGTAEVGNPNQRASTFEHKWTPTWELLGILSWSPNDFASGGARAGQVAAQRAQTLADMAALEDALRLEVSQAYEDHQSAHQAMDAALSGIRAANETYRVRREQFRAGAAVATDVVIAEGDLNRARLELVNAAIDLRIARARLERAVESN